MKKTLLGCALIGSLFYVTQGSAPPALFEGGTKLQIQLSSFEVVEENGIGDDWTYKASIDQRPLSWERITIDLSNKEAVVLLSEARENDPSHDDEGSSTLRITPENLPQLLQQRDIIETVRVREHYGKGAGQTAICEFHYVVTPSKR